MLYAQECTISSPAISRLEQWGLDPLEPRYKERGFIASMVQFIGAPPEIREQALRFVVDNGNEPNQEIIQILNYPDTSSFALSGASWETKSQVLQYILTNSSELNQEIDRILNYPLMRAILAGKLQSLDRLLKNGGNLSFIDPQYPLVKFLINWIDFQEEDTSVKMLQLLKKNKAVIKEKFLLQSLTAASAPFIAELFAGQKIAWTKESALECLAKVQSRSEELIWETLKSAGWPFDMQGVLSAAIEERNLKAVQWLLKQDTIKIQESDRQSAWDCGDLEIIECLISSQEIIDRLQEQSEIFQNFFLFSKLEKIQEYKNPISLHDILCKTALIARYTKKHELLDFVTPYKIDLKKHVQNQMEFGAICHQAVLQKLQDVQAGETDLMLTIDAFAKVRFQIALNRMDKWANHYATFRTDMRRGPLSTPFGALSWKKMRYSFVIPWMNRVAREQNGYTLNYTHPETLKTYPLTTVDLEKQRWLHTNDEVLLELWPVLQSMHAELLAMKIDSQNSAEVQQFQEKVATAYWLGCNLMITFRGNAQYFLMWLSMVMQYHGFDPLLAKRETPQPDCLAISLPLSDFVAAFPSFFENPIS